MLANEIERMACAMMAKGECYKKPVALAVRFTVFPSMMAVDGAAMPRTSIFILPNAVNALLNPAVRKAKLY